MILTPVGTGRGSITNDKCEKHFGLCCVMLCLFGMRSTPSSHLVGVEENEENE
jgi:hypothetical protein